MHLKGSMEVESYSITFSSLLRSPSSWHMSSVDGPEGRVWAPPTLLLTPARVPPESSPVGIILTQIHFLDMAHVMMF